jgi:hypothetical protein
MDDRKNLIKVFRCNIEKRIRSLPEIDGLSKETVINSWMAKFDLIMKGVEEDAAQTRQGRFANKFIADNLNKIGSFRGRFRGINQANADSIQNKEQLYDMFQQILNVKKFEVL